VIRARLDRILLLAVLAGSIVPAKAETFVDSLSFLNAAGPVSLQNFEQVPLVGNLEGGGVGMLSYDGFRAVSDLDVLKVLHVPDAGNHGIGTFSPRYFSADSEYLWETPTLALQFEPAVTQLGFFIVDLDAYDMDVTINDTVYVIPATGNGGVAYFGIISDDPIAEVTFVPGGPDIQYSLDDISFSPPPASVAAGAVPNGSDRPGTPLTISHLPDGDLLLAWGTSCRLSDLDFEIYEGALGDFTSHLPMACTTGDLTEAALTPPEGPAYYLVVPRNQTREGSYGRASDGSERPAPVSTCLLQAFAACP